MAQRIVIPSEDVWKYFRENKSDMIDSMHEIASREDFGVSIYLTEEGNLPKIVVTADDIEVYSEQVVSESDCRRTAAKVYEDYLTEKAVDLLAGSEDEPTHFDLEVMIEDREAELDEGLCLFLSAVCGDDGFLSETVFDDEMVEDCKEHFLEYLARKWGISIHRPMFLDDENGEEFFEEYPYEHMIFEDEDNPIYK